VNTQNLDLGYLAYPDADTPLPGVVLIHDVWGLGDHPRDLARRLASEGFAVLAVDLYRRLEGVEIEDAGAWIRELDDPQVLDDLRMAAQTLASHPSVAGGPVGLIGFCMGGMYVVLGACLCAEFSAAVPFYGLLSHQHGMLHTESGLDPARKPHEPLAVASRLGCPLLGFFGAEDAMVPVGDVRALEETFAGTEHASEIVVVEGAGHAFMNDTRPDAYRESSAREAWTRMVDFLGETLSAAAD
jgi:carboxymethylenebutenolidase